MKRDTLCWTCANATGGGVPCEWVQSGRPVEGWTAKPTTINQDITGYARRITNSFLIKKCPKYIPDGSKPAPIDRSDKNGKKYVTYADMSIILKCSISTIQHLPSDEIIARLKGHGINVAVTKHRKRRSFKEV